MQIIKYDNVQKGKNSDKCKTLEYSFRNKNMDLGVAEITGRYPEKGYCVNLISEELIYVLEGNGILNFKEKTIAFKKGDAILINANELYYWDTNYCVVTMSCTPAWTEEQHKLVEE